jgi:hypothetical protein
MLGGPEIAIRPRVSLDGRIVAFQAMVKGLTQLAVMTPECTLYNDRVTDVP